MPSPQNLKIYSESVISLSLKISRSDIKSNNKVKTKIVMPICIKGLDTKLVLEMLAKTRIINADRAIIQSK